jgi:hypothetical protein
MSAQPDTILAIDLGRNKSVACAYRRGRPRPGARSRVSPTRVIVGNPANGRVLESVGFTLEGRLRSVLFGHSQFQDAETYSILRGEWSG